MSIQPAVGAAAKKTVQPCPRRGKILGVITRPAAGSTAPADATLWRDMQS